MFAIEESVASVYRKMGRGRNVPVDQNQKKPKVRDDKEENIISGSVFIQNSAFLPDDVVNGMKRMTPQQNVEFLLNNR